MSELSLGPVGIALNVSADDTYLKEAAEAEELGYSAIWLPGGQIDSLDRIAKIVGATTSVPVVPGIIPLDVYRAAEVVQLYAQLQASAPGPFRGRPGRPAAAPAAAAAQATISMSWTAPSRRSRPDGGSWPHSAPASSSWPGTGPPGP